MAQLEALKIFPNMRTVRQLRRELKNKLRKIEDKIEQLELEKEKDEEEPEVESDTDDQDNIEGEANKSRSSAMKKYHRYIRLIHVNYPEYSYKHIRSMLAQRRRGREVDIPDVVWQNPSP